MARIMYTCMAGFLFPGLMVGFFLTLSSLCFFAALLAFFVCGSKATKYKSHLKHKLEDDFKEGACVNQTGFSLPK